MTRREEDLDMLKALSVIDGAVMNEGNQRLQQIVSDHMDWIVDMLVARLKEKE